MKAITRLILAIVVAASRGVSAQASTPQVVTFNNDDSLTDITSIIQATSQYRLASAGSGRTLKAADPLTQSLNNYVNSFSNPTVELLPLTSDIVINTTARIAELPQSKHLLTLTDQLHQWLADPANEASIKDALDANSTLQNIEQLQYENSTMVCERLFQYSNNVVSGTTKTYCCSESDDLPMDSLGIVCTARIHQDVTAFMLSPGTTEKASSLGQGLPRTSSLSPAQSRRLLDKNTDYGPCSPQTIGDLRKGILPTVTCCFDLLPAPLKLCIKVKGEVDLVEYPGGGNAMTVFQGYEHTDYCASTTIMNGFLQEAQCHSKEFAPIYFQTISQRAFIEVDTTLCLTSGPVYDFLIEELGSSAEQLCFAQLDLKFYETLLTLGFHLDVGTDLGSYFDFDFVAEGQLQLGDNPALCSFVLNNFDPSNFYWCGVLNTPGCWWSAGDSDLDLIIRLQAIGLVSKRWSWPIFTKPNTRGCLPAVPTKGPTPPPLPPPHIVSVGITFCVKGDGKDGDTKGSVDFSLSDGTTLASVQLPSATWGDRGNHNLQQKVDVPLTAAQAASSLDVRTHIRWNTNGRDDMLFDAVVRVTFNSATYAEFCVASTQHVGCGDHCDWLGNCPQNNCQYDMTPFSIHLGSGAGCSQCTY